jgi:hypothetical protein
MFSLIVFFPYFPKPQCSALGPLLFSLSINDLCAVVTSLYHIYADDFQIYAGDTHRVA